MAYGLSIVSTVTVQDSKGKESTMSFNHPLAVDIGALKSAIVSTVELIDTLIRGQIVRASIGIEINLPAGLGLKATAVAGADVEEGVQFNFETSLGALTGFRIPTFAETFLNDSGFYEVVAQAVEDFKDRILAGQTVGLNNVSPSDAYGDDVVTFLSAQESFASSRA